MKSKMEKNYKEIAEQYYKTLNTYVLVTICDIPIRQDEDHFFIDKKDLTLEDTFCIAGGFCWENDLIEDFLTNINDLFSNVIKKEGVYSLRVLFECDKDIDSRTYYEIVDIQVLNFLTFEENKLKFIL
jgi:hypothetical protein